MEIEIENQNQIYDSMFNGFPILEYNQIPSNPVNGWRLPAMGTEYTTCGKSQDMGCLNSGKHIHFVGGNNDKHGIAKRVIQRCNRPSCPICGRTWMVKATKECEKRILAGKPRTRRKAIHVTISPPPILYQKDTKNDFHLLRRQANRWLKIAGMDGYMLVYHPFRQNKEKRYEGTPQYLQWRYSPHFHAIGYGWINWTREKYINSIPQKKFTNEKIGDKGWIVKNHLVRKSVGATIYYQLSHAGVKELRKVISWGGILSWRRLVSSKPRKIRLDCPLCGDRFRPIKYIGKGSHPLEGSTEEFNFISTYSFEYGQFRSSHKIKKTP